MAPLSMCRWWLSSVRMMVTKVGTHAYERRACRFAAPQQPRAIVISAHADDEGGRSGRQRRSNIFLDSTKSPAWIL